MRVCYSLMQFRRQEDGFEPLAEQDVDLRAADGVALLEGLQVWAAQRLAELRRGFGLYIAEFACWSAEGCQEWFLRELSIVWDGSEILAVHINHGPAALRRLRDSRATLP